MNKVTYDSIGETLYKKTLKNGLDVFLLPKPEMSKVYGIFMTDYGSMHRTFVPINETAPTTVPDGVAHFLEHKLFEKEDYDVFTNFLEQGASPNAFTSFTKTAYLFSSTKSAKENVETLLDFVQAPYFSDETVEKEKGIITQEYHMYDDQADWRSYMGTIKNMFQEHPVNIDILGTVESINAITKEDLYTCYNTFYHPSNMSLFVIGNFDVEEMAALIEANQQEKEFSELKELETFFPEEPREVGTKESVIHLPVSTPKVSLGIKEIYREIDAETRVKRETLQGMALEYFFSTSGDFYEQLYEEGLIDDSFSYGTNVESNFGFSIIGSNSAHPEKLAARLKELLLSSRDMQIAEADFDILKKMRIGHILKAMNSLEYVANKYIQYDFAGFDFFDVVPFIQGLTVEDVNAFLAEWIEEDRLTVCTVKAE